MTQLRIVCTRLSVIGRAALVGTLAGMLATQEVAEGAASVNPRTTATPETASVPSGPQTEQIDFRTTANLPLSPQTNSSADPNALPNAPSAATESSSLNMPLDLKAMMADAGQNVESQNAPNGNPAPATKPHGVQRPGMLVMGIIGVPLIVLGAKIFTISVANSKTGDRDLLGSLFLVPGAAMSGLGFYFAFKPKQ